MEQPEALSRIAFEFGPITVYWYGVIIITGIMIGLWLANHEANKKRLPNETITNLVLWALPISIITARIYYVIFQWDYYSQNLGDVIKIWEGGIAIHGALIGAVVTAVVYSRKKNISFWLIADIVAPSLILAQAIGRWGNFMNQEAHGGPVSREFLEGLKLPEFIINQMYIDGQYFHPTFLYESVWNVIGFVILILLRRAKLKTGELFLIYVIWYSFGRFFIEGLRTDSLMLTDTLRMAQVISIILIFLAIGLFWYRRVKEPKKSETKVKQNGKTKNKKKKSKK
ncbi:prolipoprotein diacylglyceryl transferase [Siminovitchia sp. 179-K 8D1 HS]|uniref:prolipoprotein diacylglyceryl transferase n=1 Tax=Siminovitchia sp. 179-K 8D1 HS TaxID=3142385 RepID=UPI0039A1CE98